MTPEEMKAVLEHVEMDLAVADEYREPNYTLSAVRRLAEVVAALVEGGKSGQGQF